MHATPCSFSRSRRVLATCRRQITPGPQRGSLPGGSSCPSRECVLPDLSDDGGYAEFARNKAVLAIARRINQLTLYDPTRTQLLSLLGEYPRTWIHRLCQAQPPPLH